MNEQPYKVEHLQEYTGILTSDDADSEKFKMELKVEDNPVMERWTQKDKSTIELEFRYNGGPSTMFFHNRPCEKTECPECERMRKRYDIFSGNLYHLQFGDTFRIKAALINNNKSLLPAEIHNFESYQPLLVACTEYRVRLPDTPEGINKKHEREQQRLQREQDEKERLKEEEEKCKKEEEIAKRNEKWEKFEQWLDKRKNTQKFLLGYLGGLLSFLIPFLFMIYKSCSTP